MASLVFPQLSCGALVQYPTRRRRVIQGPANAFTDGSLLSSNINANYQTVWQLAYSHLTPEDQNALQSHFESCRGALLPFTFIGPTENMLASSANLQAASWQADPQLSVTAGVPDPWGGNNAFALVNAGQTDQKLSQRLNAPASYMYCLSIYAKALNSTSLSLGTASASSQAGQFTVNPSWARLVHSNRLPDDQMTITVSFIVPPAQSLVICAPQLEPQLSPSRYRPTAASGGIYSNAHFLGDSITFESDAPGLFSTLISIETT